MNAREHWEKIYQTKNVCDVSWYSEHLELSNEIISGLELRQNASIIDIGGGSSTLADDLLKKGFDDITVIDISDSALKVSKERLGDKSESVKWIVADILSSDLNSRRYDLWHDRAVFHFLTGESEREIYRKKLDDHLNTGGYFILSTFADDGPLKCSGLNVRRNNEEDMRNFLGSHYRELKFYRTSHFTPAGSEQRFITGVFQKI